MPPVTLEFRVRVQRFWMVEHHRAGRDISTGTNSFRLERMSADGMSRMWASLVENWAVVVAGFLVAAAVQAWLWSLSRVKPFLRPDAFQPLTLKCKQLLNHNTLRLRFDLPLREQR